MTNREFIFTELFILGLEHIYGPMGYEKHSFSLLDIKHGVSNALHVFQWIEVKILLAN